MREGSIRFLGFMCVRFFPSEAGLLGWTLKTSTFSNCMQVWMKMLKRSGLGQACCVHRGNVELQRRVRDVVVRVVYPKQKDWWTKQLHYDKIPSLGTWDNEAREALVSDALAFTCRPAGMLARWQTENMLLVGLSDLADIAILAHFEWMIWRVCLQRSTRNMQYAVVKLGTLPLMPIVRTHIP